MQFFKLTAPFLEMNFFKKKYFLPATVAAVLEIPAIFAATLTESSGSEFTDLSPSVSLGVALDLGFRVVKKEVIFLLLSGGPGRGSLPSLARFPSGIIIIETIFLIELDQAPLRVWQPNG